MEQFKRKQRKQPGKRTEQLKTIYEQVQEIRAHWQITILRVSQRSSVSVSELNKMDVFDFFTVLKTIKKDDTATNNNTPDRTRKSRRVY